MPKKVLFFCGASYVFGKEIVTLNLIKELNAKGVHVHCIVNGWNNGDFIGRLKEAGITYDEVKLGFFYLTKPVWTLDSLIHYPAALYKIKRIINSFDPDVLYFYSERTMFSIYPIITFRTILLHLNEPIINSKLNKYIINAFKGRKITYIVCSRYILSKISALINIEKEDVHVIYNAIEVLEKPILPKIDDTIHVGVVGQLRPQKGQDILIRALAKLKNKNFICSIYGSGEKEFENELKSLATELGIIERVIFKGFVKDINSIYSKLDIVVVPSRFEEPFGLVAIEPAQWQIPVVVSNRGGLPEVVQHGVTGLVFESGNVDSLADKLLLLFQNKEMRNELGKNAFDRANRLFNKRVMGDAFYKLLS